ncbi:MAG: TonB family protein [Sphingomonas sp.]
MIIAFLALVSAVAPGRSQEKPKPCTVSDGPRVKKIDPRYCRMLEEISKPPVEEHVTRVKLDVSAAGAVERCTVVASSGIPKVDDAACAGFAKAGFKPAVDSAGRPVQSSTIVKVRFKIEG